MNAERLLAHYARIAEASQSIPRLRRFILDLAIRGKLVPQVADGEPISKLITRIGSAKHRMVEDEEIRRPRERHDVGDTDHPFDIPPTWRWVRLDTVGAIVAGGTPSSTDSENFAEPGTGVPWITPADLGGQRGIFVSRGARDLSEKGLKQSSATVMPIGTVLFTSRAPIGYVALAANPIATNQGFKSIVPYLPECSRFIAIVMQAFAPDIDARAPGTTFKEVSAKIMAGLWFPLAPVNEQVRVVAKVDELMTLCDRLEEARNEREARRDRVTLASLRRLGTPDTNPSVFAKDVRFGLDRLNTLTSRTEQVKRLRQTILNLAVRGMLVRQDPNDEPASELLGKIASERRTMIRGGALRTMRPSDSIAAWGPPYPVPTGWAWARIGDVALFTQYGTSQRSHMSKAGVPVLAMGNIQNGLVLWDGSEKRIAYDSEELPVLYLRRMDILYNRTNSAELVGKTGIYLGEDDQMTFASYLIRLRLSETWTIPRYINMAMNAPIFRSTQVTPLIKKQTGQANVNGSALRNMLVPLPPLVEQRRIVAKVDELIATCERLEASIASGGAHRQRLLDALLAEALAPAGSMQVV